MRLFDFGFFVLILLLTAGGYAASTDKEAKPTQTTEPYVRAD